MDCYQSCCCSLSDIKVQTIISLTDGEEEEIKISKEEVRKTLKKMKSGKAVGPKNIHVKRERMTGNGGNMFWFH